MAGTGYRQPQFSEDVVWLPVWLQPHQLSSLVEQVETQSISCLAKKDLMLQENIIDGQEGYLASAGEPRYSNFHLFLSGDDHFSPGKSSPFENVKSLHLHLSSDGMSEHCPSQLHDIFQIEKDQPTREMDDRVCNGDSVPPTSTTKLPQKPHTHNLSKDNKSSKVKSQKEIDAGVLENADVSDAIELAIAASEALAISDLLKGGLPPEVSSASSVLEIALRVKEARNQFCLNNWGFPACLNDEIDETDNLCDLDEAAMEYAFEDVGLSQKNSIYDNSDGLRPRNSELESLHAHHEKPCGGASFYSHQLVTTTRNGIAASEIPLKEDKGASEVANLDIGTLTQSQVQAGQVALSSTKDLGNDVEADTGVNRVLIEPFKSRWFGGWTGQDVEVTIDRGMNKTKNGNKFFIRETSFFTESVDVVMDNCSSVNKPEAGPNLSASSEPLGDLCIKTNDVIVLSQASQISPCSSLADPLCSIVLCSISLENEQRNLEEAGKCSNNTVEFTQAEGLFPSVSIAHGEHAGPMQSGEGSRIIYRKQFSSLKTYSVLEHAQNACFNKEDSIQALFSKPTSLYQRTNDTSNSNVQAQEKCRETHENFSIENPILEPTSEKPNNVCENFSPVILNYGNRRFRACKIVESGDIEEYNSNKALMLNSRKTASPKPKKRVNFGDRVKGRSPVPLRSSLQIRPLEKESLSRKKVRFSDTSKKIPPGDRTCLPCKTAKKVKDRGPSSRLGEVNYNFPTSCEVKNGKRMVFWGLEFLLTGFSRLKEKEFDILIRKNGGFVLSDVPTPPSVRGKRISCYKNRKLPVVIAPHKVQTTKFLYGCAANTFLLKASWLTDSIVAGFALPSEKYLIQSNQAGAMKSMILGQPVCSTYIFERVGIMLYGKPRFCSKLADIIKHGGGQVFKTLQWLVLSLKNGKNSVGAIVVEDEGRASRQLRHCALEEKLQMVPESWIVDSLLLGKQLPFKKSHRPTHWHMLKKPEFPESEEI